MRSNDTAQQPRTHRSLDEPLHPIALATCAPFRSEVAASGLNFDTAQCATIDALANPAHHGYYLWGGVGRGKSLLAETYFDAIPTERKRRFHFHDFFRQLQHEIIRTRQPLPRSLERLIGNARAIFFDEFHVHDVADGVYLAATLEQLISADVLILASSNYEPAQLMPDPLHHHRFEATIDVIRHNLDVLHIADGEDYRYRSTATPHGFASGTWSVQPGTLPSDDVVDIDAGGHRIRVSYADADHVSATFAQLCETPLGAAQYLWLAEHFDSVSLTAVPDLAVAGREPLARFATLVDVLTDRDVRLDVVSSAAPDRLFDAAEPPRDAKRTVSRLSALSPVGGAVRAELSSRTAATPGPTRTAELRLQPRG